MVFSSPSVLEKVSFPTLAFGAQEETGGVLMIGGSLMNRQISLTERGVPLHPGLPFPMPSISHQLPSSPA